MNSALPPTDLIDSVRERLLTQLLRAVALVGIGALLATLLLAGGQGNRFVFVFFSVATLVTALIAFVPSFPYALRAFTFLTLVFLAALLEMFRGGLVGDGPLWLLGFALFAILFGGTAPGVFAMLTSIMLMGLFGLVIHNGLLTIDAGTVGGYLDGANWPYMLLVLLIILFGPVIGLNRLLRQIETSAVAEAAVADRLEQERLLLEKRVANRTRALETSARLANRLARILDQGALMAAVVDDLQRAFQYYHVQIYLLPPGAQYLSLAGATGPAGKQLLAAQHQVPVGPGPVGRAAATARTVLAPDVTIFPGWTANPLLPETRAEIAVPIFIGRRVAGVLAVQQNRVGRIGADDAALLDTIAAQVGIALQNAALFADARRRAEIGALQVEAGQAIRRTRTVEDALRVTSQLLGDLLQADETTVLLTGPQADTLQGNAA